MLKSAAGNSAATPECGYVSSRTLYPQNAYTSPPANAAIRAAPMRTRKRYVNSPAASNLRNAAASNAARVGST
jgi:hypothetical protein